MNIPFTTDQFLDVFATYNHAVWPMQVVHVLLALAAIFFILKRNIYSDRIVVLILSFFWIWIGVVYHILFFAAINPAAYIFGSLNIIQAGIFIYYGIIKPRMIFQFKSDFKDWAGTVLIAYAMIIYPILGYFFGHMYPQSPTFGLPCPTTIFTFGLLLWTQKQLPIPVLIIPLIWSVIGFSAALKFGILEDTGLLVAALACVTLIILNNRKTVYHSS
jgi:hypothetical protein